jgi:hypothetical protein
LRSTNIPGRTLVPAGRFGEQRAARDDALGERSVRGRRHRIEPAGNTASVTPPASSAPQVCGGVDAAREPADDREAERRQIGREPARERDPVGRRGARSRRWRRSARARAAPRT